MSVFIGVSVVFLLALCFAVYMQGVRDLCLGQVRITEHAFKGRGVTLLCVCVVTGCLDLLCVMAVVHS